MSFTFAQIPSEILVLICGFISGQDLLRLECVEAHLHRIMSSRSFWMARLSTKSLKQMKHDEIIASAAYRIQIQVYFEPVSYLVGCYLQLDDLNEVRSLLLAIKVIQKRKPEDGYSHQATVWFPNRVKLCQEQNNWLINDIKILDLDAKENKHRMYYPIEIEWGLIRSFEDKTCRSKFKFEYFDKASLYLCTNVKKYLAML